jgi:hypothetical protein
MARRDPVQALRADPVLGEEHQVLRRRLMAVRASSRAASTDATSDLVERVLAAHA